TAGNTSLCAAGAPSLARTLPRRPITSRPQRHGVPFVVNGRRWAVGRPWRYGRSPGRGGRGPAGCGRAVAGAQASAKTDNVKTAKTRRAVRRERSALGGGAALALSAFAGPLGTRPCALRARRPWRARSREDR